MREREPLGHLAADLDRLDRRDRALLDALAQVGALEKLHRQVRHAVDFAEVVGGDDVRMGQLARRLGLEEEALVVLGAALGVLFQRDGLQRDDAVEVRVLGLVHHAHRAAPQLTDYLVAADLLHRLRHQ